MGQPAQPSYKAREDQGIGRPNPPEPRKPQERAAQRRPAEARPPGELAGSWSKLERAVGCEALEPPLDEQGRTEGGPFWTIPRWDSESCARRLPRIPQRSFYKAWAVDLAVVDLLGQTWFSALLVVHPAGHIPTRRKRTRRTMRRV